MKKLLIALVAAVAVSTVFAKLTYTQGFEGSSVPTSDFVADMQNEDASELVAYDNDGPSFDAPYNFDDFGSKYLALDTGDATLWRTNAGDAAYFDMVMQFNPSASAPTLDAETKIAVYLNSSSNLVVLAGPKVGDDPTEYPYTGSTIAPGTWARLTIAKNGTDFDVYLNATKIGTYASLTGDASILSVGFKGSGKLDDFVARTTDPFSHPANYVAKVGGDDGEYYETFAAALADGQTAVTINSSAYSFSTQNGGAYDAETNPYVIANVEDLLALMYGGDKTASYVQTANIDMAGVAPYLGIDNFSGVYDGGNFAISNVTLAVAEYTGIFRTVTGTAKNLTVSNMGFAAGSTGSFGCAIVGKADGNAVIQNIKAEGTFCGAGDAGARHNTAGIVVIVETAANGGTVQILDCVNNATVYGRHNRVGGILAYTRNEGNVIISNCVNNGELVWTSKSDPADPRGIAGIVACPEGTGTVTIMDCVNTGSFTVNGAVTQANVDAATGDIVGYFYGKSSSGTFVENGGNTYRAAGKLYGAIAATVTVTKCPYAIASTVDAVDYLTTVKATDLAAGNTYVLQQDVAAGSVYTFDAAGTIAFNTNGYNFAGSVAVANPNMLDVETTTSDATITFTAVGGTAVASITKGEPATTTQYNTLAKALAAATSGDTIVLLADNTAAFSIPAGVTVDCSTFVNTGTIGGSGTIKVNASPAANLPTFANDWVGTYQVAWNPDSSNARINFNDLGNANSKVEIVGVNGQFIALPSTNWGMSSGGTPTIQPELVITASWVINNGWSTTTTINKLSGTGELVVNGSSQGDTSVPYTVNTIDGFSGTLKGTRSQYTLGNIVYEDPAFGECLVKIGSSTFAPTLDSTTLNGNAANLCFDTLNAQKGVYLVAAAATVDGVTTGYASVANAIAAVGTPTGNTSVPTVAVYDSSSAEYPGWTLDGATYTYGGTRAKIGTAEYKTLTLALAAAGTETATEIDLVGACSETVTIPANVTVDVANGVAFTGAISGDGTVVYKQTPGVNIPTFTDGWVGTVRVDYSGTGNAAIDYFGRAGSTVEFSQTFSGYYNPKVGDDKTVDWEVGPALKITGNFTFNDGTNDRYIIFPKVTGDGVLSFTNNRKYAIASLENWDGIITNSVSNVQITNIVSGTGTILCSVKPTVNPTIGSGWEGTFVADWAGANDVRFDINAYGNENSVVEVTKLAGGYVSGSNANVTVVPTVNVSGSMLLDNGYSGKITTFTKLTGSGVFSNMNYTVNVTTLDNFTGTLTPLDGSGMFISTISLDAVPESGSKVVSLGTGANIRAIASTKVSVGGVVQDIELEVIEGSEGYGIYVKDNTVYVAQIGDDKFETLAAAVAAAQDGDTIVLIADANMPSVEFADKYGVSSAQGDSEIVINKAITLDGDGHTIYGLANYFTHEMADGCHDIFITGSKNVTIKNVTLSDFGGSAYVSKFTYPIWVGQGYTGTLTLDGVTVTDFNRTAFNFNGGTVVVTNCTVVGDAPTPRNSNGAYFQNGIGVLNANVTVYDSTFSGIGAYDPDHADSNEAECFQLMGNGATSGTGSITVNGGSYSGQYVAIVAYNATGTITLNGGTFTGDLDVEESSSGTISIPGSSTAQFDRDQTDFCEAGYKTVQSGDWYVVAPKVYYTVIELNTNALAMVTNTTEHLTATTTPASAADDSITWGTSDATVATVDQNGVVTAVGAGTATITVTATHDSSVTASCTVTVTAPEPQPETPEIKPGESVITVNVKAENAEDAIAQVTITPPDSGIDVAEYTALFNIGATPGSEAGTFDVSITGIKDSVVTGVDTSAVALLTGSASEGTIAVPAGLYYKITPSTALPISGTPVQGLSTTGASATVTKPGTTQGFYKVELSATPFAQE